MSNDEWERSAEEAECVVYRDGLLTPEPRRLVREEPLAISLDGRPLVTLMRTPGHERELALGFLLTEGLISSARDVGLIQFCESGAEASTGQLQVQLAPDARLRREPDAHRSLYSSCSLCGAEAIASVADDLQPFTAAPVDGAALCAIARRLRAHQPLFDATGAVHAAAFADLAAGGADATPLLVREDLGRHNALDKAVGAAAMQRRQWTQPLLLLSGRLSFEMVAKAARAGVAAVAGVSAPTALSVALAQRLSMFVAGFVRGDTFTVYAGSVDAAAAAERTDDV